VEGIPVTAIEITGLTVHFGGVRALNNVALTAAKGQIVGLIGPNGAGKSTLLNCISGITRPTAGKGLLDGVDLFTLPPHRIAALGVARVFQQPELIANFTSLDNLLIASHRSLRYNIFSELLALPATRAQEAAARVAATKLLKRLDLAADLTVPVSSLPYGHRKLLEVGRAILTGARFMLLDEPVAGLNEAEIDRLARLVLQLRQELGLGFILVEHNMGLVSRLCDHAVVLDAGTVIARGTPGEVLRDPKVMTAYLGEEAA
jgi:branched-chain amino acid transport system ATP-binding protein